MKIIDLLNKIANDEEAPKKIKVDNRFYYEYDENIDYKSKDGTYLFDTYIQINKKDMNMEVEIIEEDKRIEKLDIIPYEKCIHDVTHKEKEILLEIRDIQMKFNKIIDYLMENKQ